MPIWVARDKDGTLIAYQNKPKREEERGIFVCDLEKRRVGNYMFMDVHRRSYPKITWENSPQRLVLK